MNTKHRTHQNSVEHILRKSHYLHNIVIVLLVLQIITLLLIALIFIKFNFDLNRTEKNLSQTFGKSLEEYKIQNQENIEEIMNALSVQEAKQGDFEQSISRIKASQADFSGIIEEAIKGVVGVVTESSLGTGFFINSEGYVVTNEHVVSDAQRIRVLTYDKKTFNATLIGADALRDVALLKIDERYRELELANSDDLQVGEKVIAIGNPLGLSFSVTEGIISALNRRGPNNLREYIQTDVSLNPGNSGGPLIDRTGNVVGINNFKIGGAESLGFALESNSIKKSINMLANQTIIK